MDAGRRGCGSSQRSEAGTCGRRGPTAGRSRLPHSISRRCRRLHAQRPCRRHQDRRRVVQEFSGSAYSDQANLAAARVQAENAAAGSGGGAPDAGTAAARVTRRWRWWRGCAWHACNWRRASRTRPSRRSMRCDAGAFTARYAEARGDALLAKGDREGALKQYREARASGADTVDPRTAGPQDQRAGALVRTFASAAQRRSVHAPRLLVGCSKDKADKPAELVPLKQPHRHQDGLA